MTRFTHYERRRDAAWITLDDPAKRNALSEGLVGELGAQPKDFAAIAATRATTQP